MTMQITWHLIVMIVITVLFIVWIANQLDDEWGFLGALPTFLLLVVIWAIYGGIVWW